MKFIKKAITIIIIVVFLLILAFWSPWNKMNFSILNFLGIDSATKYASLKVKSLQGTLNVYLDDELMGEATDNLDFAEIDSVLAGDHTVTLKKEGNGNYYQFERKVNFEPGMDVVLAYDLGPSQIFSEGHLLYSRKNYLNISNPKLSIYSNPEEVTVYMNEVLIGNTVIKDIELDNTKQHKLKFVKSGYDNMEITLLPQSQEDRDKIKNYDLILEVNLFTQPIKINYQN